MAQSFDLARPTEAMLNCMRLADHAFLLELTGENPLGWHYPAYFGIDRLKGAAGTALTWLGELPDPRFTSGVLIPTYLDVIAADQPVVHRIAAIANNTFLAYHKMTVPLRAAPHAGRASHLLTLTRVDFAIPQIRSHGAGGSPLTFRERQCLSQAASGLVVKQIAAEIGVSEKTVELHLARARHKLAARTTTQAVAVALARALDGCRPACDLSASRDYSRLAELTAVGNDDMEAQFRV
ncbi:LuxR C-terminal-related transcriptional regulator [Mesorhizobium mediterraneum]|uniref:LuxR C-terminal-related transcriptional regulator n=1 Tax=Mesorhizobium mediterraneum TaxID=43617 RepID=UPI0017816E54